MLTVPATAAATLPAEVVFKRVLCAVDFSPSSLKALEYALDLARQANGRVTVLHVLEYMEPEEPCEHVDGRVRANRQHAIDRAHERLHSPVASESTTWCDIDQAVLVGHRTYTAILGQTATASADLIVIGAQGTGGLELMLYGSNTHHVVRAAPCPVLTVRA